MKKLIICAIVSLFFASAASAQQSVLSGGRSTVRGTVLDGATNQPLTGAVVMIDSAKFAVVDLKGMFSITDVPHSDASSFIVDFLGYGRYTKSIKISNSVTNMGVITMYEEPRMLERAVVAGEAVIALQKGDTTQYMAAAFKTNPDAYAADLVNKMPGMSVEGTTIEVQGETVKRVYVDGKLTFGEDPMSALNNIPADAIESVQMFDELSDEAKFTGYNDGQLNRALNLVTVAKTSTYVDASIDAGYGLEVDKNMDGDYQGRYLLSGRANIWREQDRFVINAGTNNNNSSSGRMRGSGGGFGSSGLSTATSAGVGYSREWADKLKLNLNYNLNKTDNETASRTIREYYPTDQYLSRIYADTSSTNRTTMTHSANARIEYTMNANNKFMFMPAVSFSDNTSNGWNSVNSTTLLTDNTTLLNRTNVTNNGDGNNYNVGGNFSWVRNLGKAGRSFSLSTNLRWSESDADNLQLDEDPSSTRPMNTVTYTTGKNNSVGATLRYTEPLSPASSVSANYRISYEDSKQDKLAFDSLTMQVDEILSNVYTRNYTTNNGGLSYSYFKGSSRLNVNVNYEAAKMNKEQSVPVIAMPSSSYTFQNILPSIMYRYMKDRSKVLLVNYNTSVGLPSVEQLQNVINNSNPLQLTAGNPELKESYTHNLSLRYTNSNTVKSTSLALSLSGSLTQNSVANKTRFFTNDEVLPEYNNFEAQQGSQLVTPVNVNGQYTLRANATYSFPVRKISSKVNLSANYGYQRRPSYDNEMLNYSNTNEASVSAALVSNVSENVDFTLSSGTRYNFVNNSVKSNSEYLTQSLTGQVNIIFLGGFVFTSDITYNFMKNYSSTTGYDQNYTLWNAGLGRKFLKNNQAEFRVSMYDILKENVSLSHSIQANYIQDSWNNTMGRYVMFSFSYRFNSMKSQLQRGSQGRDYERGNPMREGGFSGGIPAGVQPSGGPMGGGMRGM